MLRLAIENNDRNKKISFMDKCFVFDSTYPSFLQERRQLIVLMCHLSFGGDMFGLVALLAPYCKAQYFYSAKFLACM